MVTVFLVGGITLHTHTHKTYVYQYGVTKELLYTFAYDNIKNNNHCKIEGDFVMAFCA